jgi:hypothetical protein
MRVPFVHHFHTESGTVEYVGPGVYHLALTIDDGLVEIEPVASDPSIFHLLGKDYIFIHLGCWAL